MTYVVPKAGKQPRWAYHSGFGDMHDAQICTYFVRSAESKRKTNKKNTAAGSRAEKKRYTKPTRGNENTAGLGQVTKKGQAKPAQTGRRNHHRCLAWLRKCSQLNQWLEGQGSTPTRARKPICARQKWNNPKRQGSTPTQAREHTSCSKV